MAWMLRRPITSRMALSATDLMVPSGFCRLKTKSCGARGIDLPHRIEIDVDDVLVAGEHQALFDHVTGAALACWRRSGSRPRSAAAR